MKTRGKRRRRGPLLAPFSIFLLGFGLTFWLAVFFTSVAHSNCDLAINWLSGWFAGGSLFQLFGTAIGGIALLYILRTLALRLWRTRTIETIAQGVFIAALIFAFGGLKALLLPFGFPPQAFYEQVAERVFGARYLLMEERDALVSYWPYDYPAPPPAPWELKDPSFAELFPHLDSPWPRELAAAEQCRADHAAAVKAYRDWEKGFDAHMKKEGWRYYR